MPSSKSHNKYAHRDRETDLAVTVRDTERDTEEAIPSGEDLDLVQVYKNEMRQYASEVSNEQMKAWIVAAQSGDADARELVIGAMLRLGMWAANKRKRASFPLEEAISVFNEALMESIDRVLENFDPTQHDAGYLRSYILKVAERRLKDAAEHSETAVLIPRERLLARRKVRRVRNQAKSLGIELTKDEVASGAGITPTTLEHVDMLPGQGESLEALLPGMDEGEEPRTLSSIIADPMFPNHEHQLGQVEGRAYLVELFTSVLTPLELDVMVASFGMLPDTEPSAWPKVAEVLGLSVKAVDAIRKTAYPKLKRISGLQEFLHVLASPHHVGQLKSERCGVIPPDAQSDRPQAYNPHRKLTPEKVREIRKLRKEGWYEREVAERFGVNEYTVYSICSRRTWRHV